MIDETQAANGTGPATGSGVNRLIKSLKNKQRELWLKGEHAPAEELLKSHPELNSVPEVFSLVYGEYLLREEVGNVPKLDEFRERFPHFADKLEQQLKLHHVFGNTNWRDSTQTLCEGQFQDTYPVPDIPGFDNFVLLGRGGMGLVYQARQIKLDRLVAVKMMIGGIYAGPESLSRFRSEAEAVAHLDHPNIVSIFEVGEWNGLLYFTMKLVESGPLSQHLDEFKHDRKKAASLVAEIARALHYAHQRGVLHRDLKPSNILVDKEGKPYVTDFGLAKRVDRNEALTATGCVGTPGYVAPEQAAGQKSPTVAIDVWGLGTILYELLTRRAPYASDTPLKAIQDVMERDPHRPRSIDASINTDLETICLKALSREPERRYSSAQAMAEDLERWVNGEPIQARAARPAERLWRWAKRRPAIAGLILACLVTTLAGVTGITIAWLYALTGWHQANELGQKATREQVRAEQQRDEAENHLYFSRIAQASFEEKSNNPESARRLLNLCLPPTSEHTDRRGWEWHYLQGLLQADILTISQPHEEITFDLAFSPDGNQLVTAGGSPYRPFPPDRIRVWNVWGDDAIKPIAEFAHPRFLQQVRFLPDGKRIIWFGDDRQKLNIAEVETKRIVQSLSLSPGVQSVAISADGNRFAVGDENGRYQVIDVVSGQQIAEFVEGRPAANSLTFSADASVLAITTRDAIQLKGIDKPLNLRLETSDSGRSKACFSNDGKRVAIGTVGVLVRVWDAQTGHLLLSLTGHDGDVRAVAFSPVNQFLASTGADHTVRLWSINKGEEVFRFRGHQGRGMSLCFHPSGRFLASGAAQPSDVKIWDLTRHQEYLTVKNPGSRRIEGLVFTPDNRHLHVIRGGGTLQHFDTSTGNELASSTFDMTPRPIRPAVISVFSHDARLIAAVNQNDTQVVNIVDASNGQTMHRLVHSHEVKHLAISRDGKRLVSSATAQKKGDTREIKVWDTQSGNLISSTTCDPFVEDRTYGPVAINSDGSVIAHEEYDAPAGKPGNVDRFCQLVLRNANTGAILHRVPEVLPRIERINFNNDGTLLAISCEKRGVIVYDTANKKWIHHEPLQGSSNRTSLETFWDMAFSPDGQRLAGVNRMQLLLWDVSTGQMVLTLRGAPPPSGDNGFNPRVVWSPDGKRLAASNSDTSFSIWDAGERQSKQAKQAIHQAALKRILSQ